MSLQRLLVLLLAGFVVAVGCSGPSETKNEDPGPSAEAQPDREQQMRDERTAAATVARYETFDVSTYPVRPPKQTVEVKHRVPRQLMKGRADEGVKQTVEGFRVQVFSAQDQEAAQEFREQVRQWWTATRPEAPKDLFPSDPPIVIEYSQPYYRVRIGAFAEREAAADAAEFIQKKYSGAFVARSTVTVVR